ncbi:MAG: mono/diheme cytochrome c family protein [Myxococcota bacterium]|jgi:mono/diheme cytochrome c family protein
MPTASRRRRLLVLSALTGAFWLVGSPALAQEASDGRGPCPDVGLSKNLAALSASGLYSDIENKVIAEGNLLYAPAHTLWSDAATKRRWIRLPEGAQIDVTNPDYWDFPVDTRIWKEFTATVDGKGNPLPAPVLVETRILLKLESGWFEMAYEWLDDYSDACPVPDGTTDTMEVGWSVPSQDQCMACHRDGATDADDGRTIDPPLSFSGILLNHPLEGDEQVNLQTLLDDGRLSGPVDPAALVIPSREGFEALDRDALGYLHANCGSCHAQHGAASNTAFNAWLTADKLGSVAETPTGAAIDGDSLSWSYVKPYLIDTQKHEESCVYDRMNRRDGVHMPPFGTALVDDAGVALILEWIKSLENDDAAAIRKEDGKALIQRGRDLKRSR